MYWKGLSHYLEHLLKLRVTFTLWVNLANFCCVTSQTQAFSSMHRAKSLHCLHSSSNWITETLFLPWRKTTVSWSYQWLFPKQQIQANALILRISMAHILHTNHLSLRKAPCATLDCPVLAISNKYILYLLLCWPSYFREPAHTYSQIDLVTDHQSFLNTFLSVKVYKGIPNTPIS